MTGLDLGDAELLCKKTRVLCSTRHWEVEFNLNKSILKGVMTSLSIAFYTLEINKG